MASATPGRPSNSAGSPGGGVPVMPVAVRCAPGIMCGRKPRLSILRHTPSISAVVACAVMTMSTCLYHRGVIPRIAIVGGGIVGLATAYRLLERVPGVKITVLDKE